MSQLDAQAQAVVDELETLGGRPFEELTAAEAREQPTTADAAYALARRLGRDVEPEVVGSVEDRTLPGPGGPLPVRVYRPRETIGSARALPLLVFAHGGAWVLGDLDSADAMARALCNQARCVLVSVGYRLAPEHRFPAAHEDLLAATRWVTAHAGELDGDPARVAIAGESAGATLATATCLALRDAGERGPLLQALIVPVTDLAAVADDMAWYTNHLLSDPAEAADPRLSPLRLAIEQLAGLPPAIVVTAGADGLREQGEAYARALTDAGVQTTLIRFPGVMHGFFGLRVALDAANRAVLEVGAAVRAAFERA